MHEKRAEERDEAVQNARDEDEGEEKMRKKKSAEKRS